MGSGLSCGRLLAGWFALSVLAVSGFAQTQTQAGSARVSVEAGDPPAMASVPGEDEGPGGAVYDVRARLHREGGLPYRWMAKQILKAGVKAAGAATAKISLLGGPKAATLGGLLNAGLQNLVEVALPDVGRCGVDVEITAPASPERPFNRATNWAFGGDWALDIPFDPQGFTSPESGAFLNFDKAFPDAGPWDEREFVRAGSALSVTAADELSCTGATLETEFEFWQDEVVDPCDVAGGASRETATEKCCFAPQGIQGARLTCTEGYDAGFVTIFGADSYSSGPEEVSYYEYKRTGCRSAITKITPLGGYTFSVSVEFLSATEIIYTYPDGDASHCSLIVP